MASGAQCQVACLGAQDVYLVSPSEITFFKTTYARHTNFAMTELEMPFNNTAGFGKQKFSCKISRSGDLLYGMYVSVNLPRIQYPGAPAFPLYDPTGVVPSYCYWVNAIGHAMLEEVDCNIGAHEFDAQYSEFLEMWECLAAPSDRLMSEMTGRYASDVACAQASLKDQHLYVPMRFWFNRFTEQALPLVSLYWHDVELVFSTRARSQLFFGVGAAYADAIGGAPTMTVPQDVSGMLMLCNLIYLDRPERAAFANSKSEYIIDQTQFLGAEAVSVTSSTVNHSIRYNHPVQEIIWAIRTTAATASNDWFNFQGALSTAGALPVQLPSDPFRSAQILINNHDRTIDHPAMYYRQVQPYQSHARLPAPDRWVYCYCFGLKPEELLHTGSVNMSRMDNANLRITYNQALTGITPAVDGNLFIFARNKNVMKARISFPFFEISKLTLLFRLPLGWLG